MSFSYPFFEFGVNSDFSPQITIFKNQNSSMVSRCHVVIKIHLRANLMSLVFCRPN